MKRKVTLLTALLLVPLAALPAADSAKAAAKPNIVYMLADDLGWGDLSAHGGGIATPNIDRLFKQGVELRNFMGWCVCSPTRAMLLTGRHPFRVGTGPEVGGELAKEETTIAEGFKAGGYRTGVFGKWHNGDDPNTPEFQTAFTEAFKQMPNKKHSGGHGANAHGYNNAFHGSAGARMYYQVFAKMIAAWRETFGDPRLPFCIISLCTDSQPQTRDNFLVPMYDAGIYIREAHYQTFRDLRNAGDQTIGFASSFDLRKAWYHPQIKIPVGERAAKWTLATRYGLFEGRDAEAWWLPPTIDKVEIAGGTLRLTLSTEVKTRDDSDGQMLGFAIAGQDRRFYPADADWFTDGTKDNRNRPQYARNMLVLSNRFVPEPLHYRYAWARNPMGNMVNGRGVPLAAQRSDGWMLEETPVKVAIPENMKPEAARNYVGNQLRKILERDDLERRLQEAEASVAELKPALEQAPGAPGARSAAGTGTSQAATAESPATK